MQKPVNLCNVFRGATDRKPGLGKERGRRIVLLRPQRKTRGIRPASFTFRSPSAKGLHGATPPNTEARRVNPGPDASVNRLRPCGAGAPDYMAPEKARGSRSDQWTDMHIQGAIVCEITLASTSSSDSHVSCYGFAVKDTKRLPNPHFLNCPNSFRNPLFNFDQPDKLPPDQGSSRSRIC